MNNHFSENLKKIRKDHHLSQEQLADFLNVSRQAISKWESSTAYPEMDKILALCEKFHLSMDDLLQSDLKEKRCEEEMKKTRSKAIADFLMFLTDTVNLFCNMNVKSKLKCLFEQGVIASLLLLFSFLFLSLMKSLLFTAFSFLPTNISFVLSNLFFSLLVFFCFVLSLIIFIHVFKTRYLDYYHQVQVEKEEDVKESPKIEIKEKDPKIIIRDPKHSEYRFVNGLFKILLFVVKFFALCLLLPLCFLLVFLLLLFVLSFLVAKTGIFFFGLLCTILSSSVVLLLLILLLLNFVANRKNNKKKMIWTFLVSIIIFGMGCGFLFVGFLQFEVVEKEESLLKKGTLELEMTEDTFFHDPSISIQYVESNNDKIVIEYQGNKYCKVETKKEASHGIYFLTRCSDPIKQTREWLQFLNEKKIVTMDHEIKNVVVFASPENIQKMKENEERYRQKEQEYYESFYKKE